MWIVWAPRVAHAAMIELYAIPLIPIYNLTSPNPPVQVTVCVRFIRVGQMLYLAYELPFVLDGGHILKAGCPARLLGRP